MKTFVSNINTRSVASVRPTPAAKMSVVVRAGEQVDPITQAVQAAVLAAHYSGRVEQIVEDTKKQNDMLMKQVIEEGQRASAASRDLATIMARIKDTSSRTKQMNADSDLVAKFEQQRRNILAEMEVEKYRRAQVMAAASSGGSVDKATLERERSSRMAAEKAVAELEARLESVTASSAQNGQPQMAKSAAPTTSGPADVEALQKFLRQNEILKNQVMGETQRASAAKDLANARYRELEATKAKLRNEEKTIKKAKMDVNAAYENAKKAQGTVVQAVAGNRSLLEKVAAEERRAMQAEREAEELEAGLAQARAVMEQEEAKIRSMMDANPDAKAAFNLRSKLLEAENTNAIMKKQVDAEHKRAQEAQDGVSKIQSEGAAAKRIADQLAEQKKLRMEATTAYVQANAALSAEKARADALKAEAQDANALIRAENDAKAEAEAKVKELEAALQVAERQLAAGPSAAPASVSSDKGMTPEEKLAVAQQTITVLQQQMAGETARVNQAKELAAARQRDLSATHSRLKQQEKTLAMVSEEARKALEQARRAKEAMEGDAGASPVEAPVPTIDGVSERELFSTLRSEAERASKAESQVKELKDSLAHAKAQMSSVSAAFSSVTVDAMKMNEAQETLASALAMNEVLRKQVHAESSRSARSAQELQHVQGRVAEVESTLDSVRREALNMKDSVLALKQEINDVLSVKSDKDAKLSFAAQELARSKAEEGELQAEASKLRHSLDVARSREPLGERLTKRWRPLGGDFDPWVAEVDGRSTGLKAPQVFSLGYLRLE
eukprot:gene15777-21900_t